MIEPADGARERERFLTRLLNELCVAIGPRPAGTEADAACAEVVLRELRASCDRAEAEEFAFERWECALPARLSIGGSDVECFPYYGSPGTGVDGIAGTVEASACSTNDPVGVVRAPSEAGTTGGEPLALLVRSPFGPAVPRFDPKLLERRLPVAGIGDDALERLHAAHPQGGESRAQAGGPGRPGASGARPAGQLLPVQLRFDARRIAGARTRNVAGRIDGESRDEIVVIAHRDTQYNTPGANDNAASLATMLMLAAHYREHRPRRTLTLLATGAEEIGCLGAHEHVRRRAESGSLAHVRLCINFDSLTYGPHPHIYCPRAELAVALASCYREAAAALGVRSRSVLFDEPDSLDGAPFIERGIPALYLNSRGDDDRALRLWHRPEDLPRRVDPALVELSFRALVRFLDSVEVG